MPLKRAMDILLSSAGLVVIAPAIILAAAAIRIDSPGPAFYRQTRVGKDGETFGILKLRTMVVDADRIGGYSTPRGDPRITRVGAFLRKTSLDETPQLLNVLRGDMSLVGPRPDLPAQRGGYTEAEWRRRLSVRPGLTGLAQATLRSAATPEERKRLDLDYVERRSVRLDMKIMARTFAQMTTRGGY